jgi:hypothetical protein
MAQRRSTSRPFESAEDDQPRNHSRSGRGASARADSAPPPANRPGSTDEAGRRIAALVRRSARCSRRASTGHHNLTRRCVARLAPAQPRGDRTPSTSEIPSGSIADSVVGATTAPDPDATEIGWRPNGGGRTVVERSRAKSRRGTVQAQRRTRPRESDGHARCRSGSRRASAEWHRVRGRYRCRGESAEETEVLG